MNRLKKQVTFNNDLSTNLEYSLEGDFNPNETISTFNVYSYAISTSNEFFRLNSEEYLQTIKPMMDSLPRQELSNYETDGSILEQSKLLVVDYNDALFVAPDNSFIKLEWNEELRNLLNIENNRDYSIITDNEKIFPEQKNIKFNSAQEFTEEYKKLFEGEFQREFNKDCIVSSPAEIQEDSTYSMNIYNHLDKKMLTINFDSETSASETYSKLLESGYKANNLIPTLEESQAEIKELITNGQSDKLVIENFGDISIISAGNDKFVCRIDSELEGSHEVYLKKSIENMLSKESVAANSTCEVDKDKSDIKIIEDSNEYYLYDKSAINDNQEGNLGKIVFINQSGTGRNNELSILTTNEKEVSTITEFKMSLSDNEFKKILDGEPMKKSEMKKELQDISDFCLNKYSFTTTLNISAETDISNLEIKENKFWGNVGANEESTKLSIEKLSISENNNINVEIGGKNYQVVSISPEFETLDKFRESVVEATNNTQLSPNKNSVATYIDYYKDGSTSNSDKYLVITAEDGSSIKINTNDIKTKDDSIGILVYSDKDDLRTIYTNFKPDEYTMDTFLNKNIGSQAYGVYKIENIDTANNILILKTDTGHEMIKLTNEFEEMLKSNNYPISGNLTSAFLSSEPKFDFKEFKDISLTIDKTYVENQSVIAKPVVDAPVNSYVAIEVDGELKLFAKRDEKIFGESTCLTRLMDENDSTSNKVLNYENLRDKIEFAFIPDKPSLEKLSEMMSEPDFKISLDAESKQIIISCGEDEKSETISTVELCERQYIKSEKLQEENEYERSSEKDAELDL